MNITKEYIELCKNPKVQGLRPELIHFDFYSDDPPHSIGIWSCEAIKKYSGNRKTILWLPTGDQLDQCIVDICKRHNLDYQVGTTKKPNYWWWVTITSRVGDPDENIVMVEAEENPLIAKLKLLLSLLESEE